MAYPTLYSLQNCPYAMRARMAVLLSEIPVNLRAIVLKDKPEEMVSASPKAEVPVLILSNGQVIDQSLDIMLWVLGENDPHNVLYSQEPPALAQMLCLIERNDTEYRDVLLKYKCAKRYHEDTEDSYRQECEAFLLFLEQHLSEHKYLQGETLSLADFAVLPLIRQFAKTDRRRFLQGPYPLLRQWLKNHLESALFSKAMIKTPLWWHFSYSPCRQPRTFGTWGARNVGLVRLFETSDARDTSVIIKT